MQKINLFLMVTTFLFSAGCSSVYQQPVNEKESIDQTYKCRYTQRNLTVVWKKRSYWCVPQAGKR